MMKHRFIRFLFSLGLVILIACTSTSAPSQAVTPEPTPSVQDAAFLNTLARDTWNYLSSDWATTNHLPWSWRSATLEGGDFANPAEIGLYALAWIGAYEFKRDWSPEWAAVETEVTAVLDQLRAWQTGSQASTPHGPNAYNNTVFYQWYWISWNPPVVGADAGTNQVVPAVDNAWLAASLITIREYAEAHAHSALAQKADAILNDMDFALWYDQTTHRFWWGAVKNPQGDFQADYYSNENRIINFVARAKGDLSTEEFQASLNVLVASPKTYNDITVERVAWDGSLFTYLAPALFIREKNTPYGRNTLDPAVAAQIAYAQAQGYAGWGFSDCYDVGEGGYVQQGAPPAARTEPPEDRPGLVTPHASALALISSHRAAALTNLQTLQQTFPAAYDASYGFRDSLMAKTDDAQYGTVSTRFSALNQEWIFLALLNAETGFIWDYFYRDEGVARAYQEMYTQSQAFLPMIPSETTLSAAK